MLKGKLSRVLFFLFILIGLAVVIDIIVAVKTFEYPHSHPEVIVEIPQGASLKRTSAILADAGAISDARSFTIVVRILQSSAQIKAGEYIIAANASMGDIFKQLKEGRSFERAITLAEGLTSAQITDILLSSENLSGEVAIVPDEGTLLPETYHFRKGEARTDVLSRMQSDMTSVLDTLWLERADDFPLETKYEALILASIVEKETGIDGERGRIAAVFFNRLRDNMRLQTDPTVIYGITQGLPLGRALLDRDLEAETPYNTYIIRGLPPTPIANPGLASLEAVFDAPDSDEFYFVADGTGGHVFAESLEEHNRNVRQWRRIKRQMRQ